MLEPEATIGLGVFLLPVSSNLVADDLTILEDCLII